MAELPMSSADLEELVSSVSLSLFEKWAIEDRIPDEQEEKYANFAADDVAFVINNFMEGFNEIIAGKQREQIQIVE